MNNIIKGVIGLPVAAATAYLGGMDAMLQTLIFMMVLDYITGLMASGVEGRISSKLGYRGIIKKLGMLIAIAICVKADELAIAELVNIEGIQHPARTLILMFYIGLESISNLENLGRAGVPLPKWLKKAFDMLKDKGAGK